MILTAQEKLGCSFWFRVTATRWIDSVKKIVPKIVFVIKVTEILSKASE